MKTYKVHREELFAADYYIEADSQEEAEKAFARAMDSWEGIRIIDAKMECVDSDTRFSETPIERDWADFEKEDLA